MKRILLAVLAVAVVAVGFAFVLAGRDDSRVAVAPPGPGELQPDRGAAHDRPADPEDPLPTSGPHRPELITRDRRPLTNDELLHALELGNVVLFYERDAPPPALERIQQEISGGFDAEVAAAGQAVILARRPGTGDGTAVAWRRVLRGDPAALRRFAEAWLGAGAAASRPREADQVQG